MQITTAKYYFSLSTLNQPDSHAHLQSTTSTQWCILSQLLPHQHATNVPPKSDEAVFVLFYRDNVKKAEHSADQPSHQEPVPGILGTRHSQRLPWMREQTTLEQVMTPGLDDIMLFIQVIQSILEAKDKH